MDASSIFSERASISGSTRVSSIGFKGAGVTDFAFLVASFFTTIDFEAGGDTMTLAFFYTLGSMMLVAFLGFLLSIFFSCTFTSALDSSTTSDTSSKSDSLFSSTIRVSSFEGTSSSAAFVSSTFTSSSAFFPFCNSSSYSSSISAN